MNLAKKFPVALAALITTVPAIQAFAANCRETVLYNGKIATMDSRDTIASSVTIEGDRISAVGAARGLPAHDACASLIDLRGRTVVPGLMDGHNHIVQVSLHPGHDVRIEVASSIGEVQALMRRKAQALGAGEWITAIGGWSPAQFAEQRMPTKDELDAAAPNNPVYVQSGGGFNGPAAANTKGMAFFEGKGIKVGADGSIAANEPTIAAYKALQSIETFASRKQTALDVMSYAASVGLTTSDDKGGPWPADTPKAQGVAQLSAGATNEVDPFTGYDHLLALDREGQMRVRVRIFFYMQDLHTDLPFLNARLNNQFSDFGDAWLKVSGVGERISGGAFPVTPGAPSDVYEAAARLVAQRGWAYDQHAQGIEDEKVFAALWESINRETPLAPLRWCLAHVPGIDRETLDRLRLSGVGVSAAGSRYTSSTPPRNSPKDIPPFRMLVESGIHVGYGSDGGTLSPLDPWPHIYYMVTGKNNAGQLVADEETITRMQALRMYTSSQGWFTREEDTLGSIEPGKFADLVALSDDFLDPSHVPDEAIKRIQSVLTIVGGNIVYDSGALRVPASVRN